MNSETSINASGIFSYRFISLYRFALFVSATVCILFTGTEAKTRAVRNRTLQFDSQSLTSPASISKLENRLRPFFEHRIRRSSRSAGLIRSDSGYIPDDLDIMMLARAWNSLSPEFQSLYKQATQIPLTFMKYESPGGHFEVYYTLSGADRVDSTDNYGFTTGNWKSKIETTNGIPDYIDEVAWALDSSWSLHVDKSGFVQPIPHRDNGHTSDKYKVIVEQQDDESTYGLTFMDDNGNARKGFPSYISLRNDWSGNAWRLLGYNTHPEYGVRVTCVHELFHAVQYAMSWNVESGVFLDDFPLSCIEGSAVSMEEFAFGNVNDYLQYSDLFFMNPDMQFLDDNPYSILKYTNSLLFLYLDKFATASPGIDFLKRLFYNNYNKLAPFHENIRATSNSFGYSWPELLNSFHTASFFSGSRADTNVFLNDATFFEQWAYRETLPDSNDCKKTVNPYGMRTFYLTPRNDSEDTLIAALNGSSYSGPAIGKTWAVSMILRKEPADSIAPVLLNSQGDGIIMVPDWKAYRELIIVATNGHPSENLDFSVSFESCPVTYPADGSYTFSAIAPDNQSYGEVTLETRSDLRCPLKLTTVTSRQMLDSAHAHDLKPLSSFFQLSYPSLWSADFIWDSLSISLSINMLHKNISSFDSAAVFMWDVSLLKWTRTASALTDTADTIKMKLESSVPGIYSVFTPATISYTKVLAFPNPVHLVQKGGNPGIIKFHSDNINELRIYSSNGSLVYRAFDENEWNLKNKNGKDVIPGLYTAVLIVQSGARSSSIHQKIMVVP